MKYTSEEAERLSWNYVDSDPARHAFMQLATLLRSMEEAKAVAWVADLAPGIERPKEYMGIFTPHKSYADWMATNSNYVITPLFTHPPAESSEAKDAARYRWLRDNCDPDGGDNHFDIEHYLCEEASMIVFDGADLDEAIDDAMTAESREKEL